jgi:hypothetical protein
MRLRADRDDDRVPDPAAYWRRRFFILGGGIAVIAVLAWQFTPAHPARAPGSAATARSSMAAAQKPDDLPSAAYGSAWPGPSPAASRTTPSPTVPGSTGGASATATQKAGAAPSASSGTPQPGDSASATPGQCAPGAIVLSLFTSQASYGPGKQPQFNVYAVSTAPGPCLMAFGPGSVRVIVTRHGQVVWDSATCDPASAGPVRFELGVPQLLTISWNRAAAGPVGCAGSLPAGASGTLDAVAMSAGQDSSVRTFRLVG